LKRVVAALIVLLVVGTAGLTAAQPQYWIALNFDVTFYPDGTAVVEAKLHPFTVSGRSLFGEKDVEKDLEEGWQQTAYEILLMFTDNPKTIKFDVLTRFAKDPKAEVLCDVAGTGKISRFKGAYVVKLRVYLNSSSYVRPFGGDVYEVKVRDSFTSLDPRSWIDVISFRFSRGVELVKYRWEPSFAKGPSAKKPGYLLWVNFNEQEAPDFYVFVMKLPGFHYVGRPAEVKAKILDAKIGEEGLVVTVANNSTSSGYVYVVAKTPQGTEARKVWLWKGSVVEVRFPDVKRATEVELWSGDVRLDVYALGPASPLVVKRNGFYYLIALLVLFAALFTVAYKVEERRRTPSGWVLYPYR